MPRDWAAKRTYGDGHAADPTVVRTRGARLQGCRTLSQMAKERRHVDRDKLAWTTVRPDGAMGRPPSPYGTSPSAAAGSCAAAKCSKCTVFSPMANPCVPSLATPWKEPRIRGNNHSRPAPGGRAQHTRAMAAQAFVPAACLRAPTAATETIFLAVSLPTHHADRLPSRCASLGRAGMYLGVWWPRGHFLHRGILLKAGGRPR